MRITYFSCDLVNCAYAQRSAGPGVKIVSRPRPFAPPMPQSSKVAFAIDLDHLLNPELRRRLLGELMNRELPYRVGVHSMSLTDDEIARLEQSGVVVGHGVLDESFFERLAGVSPAVRRAA